MPCGKYSARLELLLHPLYSSYAGSFVCFQVPGLRRRFIQDEIDALATSRASDIGRPSPHEGVLTSLLNEMDGVQELNGVTVIAATNRPDVLVGPHLFY